MDAIDRLEKDPENRILRLAVIGRRQEHRAALAVLPRKRAA